MADIVLIPGIWLGASVWGSVGERLSVDHGHAVHALTLPGLAERASDDAAEVTLADHVADVLAVLAVQDLHDVVLVGHCYGGSVAGQVAAAAPERVALLVFLNAIVPWPGAWLFQGRADLQTAPRRDTEELLRRQDSELIAANGGLFPKPGHEDFAGNGMTDEQVRRLLAEASDHPGRTILDRAVLETPLSAVHTTYINCTLPRAALHPTVGDHATAEQWRFVDFDAGHWPMVTHSVQLANLLDRLAATR